MNWFFSAHTHMHNHFIGGHFFAKN